MVQNYGDIYYISATQQKTEEKSWVSGANEFSGRTQDSQEEKS